MPVDEQKYWYNSATGQVEFGRISPSTDRVGPFDTEAEAARAPQLLQDRAKAWAEEEAAEDDLGATDQTTGRGDGE